MLRDPIFVQQYMFSPSVRVIQFSNVRNFSKAALLLNGVEITRSPVLSEWVSFNTEETGLVSIQFLSGQSYTHLEIPAL